MEYFVNPWKNLEIHSGRTTRKEFWMFALIQMTLTFVAGLVLGNVGLGFIVSLYVLASCLPGIAIAVRRLRDVGQSGHMLWLVFLPVIGWLVLLYFYVQPSKLS